MSTPYIISGSHPKFLFLSGMHGDEYESGTLLKSALRNVNTPYAYIPEVSPSAVTSKTRSNAFGNDINRHFFNNTKDPEAMAVMNTLLPYTFRIAIDIHEDPDRTNEFYLYDSERMNEKVLSRYRDAIRNTKTELFTGLDDPEDLSLGCQIDQGYYYFRSLINSEGFFSKWALEKGIANRVFTVEIPGKATLEKKTILLETILPFLIAL